MRTHAVNELLAEANQSSPVCSLWLDVDLAPETAHARDNTKDARAMRDRFSRCCSAFLMWVCARGMLTDSIVSLSHTHTTKLPDERTNRHNEKTHTHTLVCLLAVLSPHLPGRPTSNALTLPIHGYGRSAATHTLQPLHGDVGFRQIFKTRSFPICCKDTRRLFVASHL